MDDSTDQPKQVAQSEDDSTVLVAMSGSQLMEYRALAKRHSGGLAQEIEEGAHSDDPERFDQLFEDLSQAQFADDRPTDDVLDALHYQRLAMKPKYHLNRALGKPTGDMVEINGHIFDYSTDGEGMDTWCRVPGCEMSHPAHADRGSCPSNLEAVEYGMGMYDERDRKEVEFEEEHGIWSGSE